MNFQKQWPNISDMSIVYYIPISFAVMFVCLSIQKSNSNFQSMKKNRIGLANMMPNFAEFFDSKLQKFRLCIILAEVNNIEFRRKLWFQIIKFKLKLWCYDLEWHFYHVIKDLKFQFV